MDLDELVQEYATAGIGEQLYRAVLRTVPTVVLRFRYPLTYSPTGRWDDDAFTALAHDWALAKLLKYGQIEHLLLANTTLAGFRKGLELSFRQFLISQKKRTALDNLFQRAAVALETDHRFRLLQDTGRKATRVWGLSSWQNAEHFQGEDATLIAAAFRVPEVPVIRYRPEALKLSPVINVQHLAEFLAALLREIRAALNLDQMLVAMKYRFNLLDASEISLEIPVAADSEGHSLQLGEIIGDAVSVEDVVVTQETAETVLHELSPRQRLILREYVQPDATLTSVAEVAGCSKSTVDNELRRSMLSIRRNTSDMNEAQAVYEQLIDLLMAHVEVGNTPG
ncbi:MAG: sigma factor-like helix-turn-helix DNA-binding protein [Dehalococcoidia bacterium]